MKKTKLLGVLAALVLVISLLPGTPVMADTLEVISGVPDTDCYGDAWGTGADDVYFVGQKGVIAHYDGETWTQMDNIVLNDLECIWGTASDNIYAGGWDGTILHYDGETWSWMLSPAVGIIFDIWGTGPDDIYAVESCVILHYDGEAWTKIYTGPYDLRGIWGTGPDDIYAVGYNETILHYDGTSWTTLFNEQDETPFRAVWGSAADDVYVAGGFASRGAIWHYDGNPEGIWTVIDHGLTSECIYDIWATGPDDVFFTCNYGDLLHYDGTDWSLVEVDPSHRYIIYCMWGDLYGTAYLSVGWGTLYRYTYTHSPPWDVNQDGSINVLDMSRVGDHFGETGTPGWIREDVNSDGSINVLDMSVIGDHFGE